MSVNLTVIPRESPRGHPQEPAVVPGRKVTESELVEYVRERVASYKYPARRGSASTSR